jgi:hypothetical protein
MICIRFDTIDTVNLYGEEVYQEIRRLKLQKEIKPTQLTTNQKAESGPENGALTGINTGLGCPPYPHQLNDPEDKDRDGLQNVGPYKTEPPYLADSLKELHHKH